MRKSKLTDFMLCMGALIVSATVALLAALKTIETNTAIVFVGLSVACIAMSLVDFEFTAKNSSRTPSKKSRKK